MDTGDHCSGGSCYLRPMTNQIPVADSSNLQQLLRVRDDDDSDDGDRRRHNAHAGRTVGSQKRTGAVQMNRTLLDIIRDESPGGAPYSDHLGQHSKKSWRNFKDRLRLRRAGAAWTSSVPIPTSDVPVQDNRGEITRRPSIRYSAYVPDAGEPAHTEDSSLPGNSLISGSPSQNSRPQITRRVSTRFAGVPLNSGESTQDATHSNETSPNRDASRVDSDPSHRPTGTRLSAALAAEREQSSPTDTEEELSSQSPSAAVDAEAAVPARMSLMALLEETDRQMGVVGPTYAAIYDDDEEEADAGDAVVGGGGEYSCCVCMVRHKGAAFIPCGHTFCRLCSRELWVSRGNCPLCNGFILEILDIF